MGLYRQRQAVEAMIAGRYEEREGSAAEAAAPEPSDEDFQFNDTVTWQGKTYRKNHYIKAVLCIGVDRSGSMLEPTLSGDGGQADGVFLLAQDTARNSLKILLIPRDSMTEITQTDTSWTDDNGKVLGKITLVGALFLGVVAVLPILLGNVTGLPIQLGGTSLLIVVGVALDTSRSMESFMVMRHHKGFLQ